MPVCRLCFGFVHQKSFLKLTFAYKCIVNNVVPELDLEMVDNSVVCKCCSSKIHEYNEFKITCYEVKQKLLKTSLVNNQIRNCRTCLNPTNNISHVILNSPDVNNIFKICLSEIDFRVSLDSVICSKCHDCLEKFYQFKMSCLQVEERLKNYIKNMNYSNPSIDLEKIKVELETFNEHRLKTTDIKVERIEDMKNVFDSNSSNIKIKEICLKSKEAEVVPKHELPKILETSKQYISDESCPRCEICNKVFMKQSGLEQHQLRKHSITPVRRRRKRTCHPKIKQFHCSLCPKSFKYKGYLNKHVKSHNEDTKTEKSYTCFKCGHSFTQKSNLKTHILKHLGRRFECTICHGQFVSKNNLKTHMEVHGDDQPYQCNICGESFRHGARLKVHTMIHFGKEPPKCQICGKEFMCGSLLRKHEKSHTGDRNYECQICRKRFVEQSTLNSHLAIHNGEKPFRCCICQRRYVDKGKLNYHLKMKCLK